jgi:hypothetical protein
MVLQKELDWSIKLTVEPQRFDSSEKARKKGVWHITAFVVYFFFFPPFFFFPLEDLATIVTST